MFPNRGDTWTEQTVLNIWSDAYSPDNIDGKYPRVGGTGSKGANGQESSFWLMNGNYFRCKNIEIGYTLPKQWTDKANIQRLRLFFSGDNLCEITGLYKHYKLDPECLGGQMYPLQRSYSFGLNVTF